MQKNLRSPKSGGDSIHFSFYLTERVMYLDAGFKGLQLFAQGGDGGGEGSAPPGETPAAAAPETADTAAAPSGDAQAQPEASGEAGQEDARQELARRQFDLWADQARQAREFYPGLDMNAEVRDPRFRQLLGAGVDVATAYLVLHKDEILPAAMRRAAQEVERRLAGRWMAGDLRPPENGIGAQSAAVTKSDVSQLSRADREDIRRRAARGEKIRF